MIFFAPDGLYSPRCGSLVQHIFQCFGGLECQLLRSGNLDGGAGRRIARLTLRGILVLKLPNPRMDVPAPDVAAVVIEAKTVSTIAFAFCFGQVLFAILSAISLVVVMTVSFVKDGETFQAIRYVVMRRCPQAQYGPQENT
jgi:hypothetical protein